MEEGRERGRQWYRGGMELSGEWGQPGHSFLLLLCLTLNNECLKKFRISSQCNVPTLAGYCHLSLPWETRCLDQRSLDHTWIMFVMVSFMRWLLGIWWDMAALTPESRLLGGTCGLLCPRPLPCPQQELLVEVMVDTAPTKAKGVEGWDWKEPLEQHALRSTVRAGGP